MHFMAVFLVLLTLCCIFGTGRVFGTILTMVLLAAVLLGAIILLFQL